MLRPPSVHDFFVASAVERLLLPPEVVQLRSATAPLCVLNTAGLKHIDRGCIPERQQAQTVGVFLLPGGSTKRVHLGARCAAEL
jgi:hypothetical protein